MKSQENVVISSGKVINAINRGILSIESVDVKEKMLRVFSILLSLRREDEYFSIALKVLGYSEKYITNVFSKENAITLTDWVNTPFLFEFLSEDDAVRVEAFLNEYITEENSLEKHLIKKFGMQPSSLSYTKIDAIFSLLNNEMTVERINIHSGKSLSDEKFTKVILAYYEAQGFKKNRECDPGVLSLQNRDDLEKMVVFNQGPGMITMITVSNL